MRLHGEFVNGAGRVIRLDVVTGGDRSVDVEIGDAASGVWFPGEGAVEITGESEDGFDVLRRKSCTIRLESRQWLPELFVSDVRDSVVRVWECSGSDVVCVFAGMIEPQVYSQPYNDFTDEIELSCVDALGALQYRRWKDIGSRGVSYDDVKAHAEKLTIGSVLMNVLYMGDSREGWQVLYDGSKTLRSSTDDGIGDGGHEPSTGEDIGDTEGTGADITNEAWRYRLWDDMSISEKLFLGKTEDDVWTCEAVVEELLKYCDLHIMQVGFRYYIYSWDSIVGGRSIDWRSLQRPERSVELTRRNVVTLSDDNVADTDTTLTLGEHFNQLLLTVKPEEDDDVLESPLNKDMLEPVWSRMQKYVTEYSSDGEGERALKGLWDMTHGQNCSWEGAWSNDWFMRVYDARGWRFPKLGMKEFSLIGDVEPWDERLGDLYDEYCADDEGQHTLAQWLGEHMGAMIAGFGKVKKTYGVSGDNSIVSSVKLDNALYMKVNGNLDQGTPTEWNLQNRIPWAVYEGNNVAGVYSPADDAITNYIVFRGKMVLNPRMDTSIDWADAVGSSWSRGASTYRSGGVMKVLKTVPSESHKDGRFYTRRYWKVNEDGDEVDDGTASKWGLMPFTGESKGMYQYRWNSEWQKEDCWSKVPVLLCMLVIGDKCVVETGNSGGPSDYAWRPYKERSECRDLQEYLAQSFTIGIDPKIDDYLVGQEYDIQNNVSYRMGLDIEGTAIPVRKDDKVSGRVRFAILSPADCTMEEWQNTFPVSSLWNKMFNGGGGDRVLPVVDSIVVKDFECRVTTDSGGVDLMTDNDIVYMSDEKVDFVNRKDDLEMKICSALTAAECEELGVSNAVTVSTPVNNLTEVGVLDMVDTRQGVRAKPEKLYVDAHYREVNVPRIVLEQRLRDGQARMKPWTHYVHPTLGKDFYVLSETRDLQSGETMVRLKETF